MIVLIRVLATRHSGPMAPCAHVVYFIAYAYLLDSDLQ